MKAVTVSYFAAFREQTGCAEEQVSTHAASVAELFAERRAQHGRLVGYEAMKFALNDRLVSADAAVHDGDRVLFFPPVAGG